MYTSVLALATASALSNFTILRGLLLAVLVAVLVLKSRFEDRLLRERHGQAAKDYQNLAGAFVPRVPR
jgi:protein-S-isoprenylcysteine O-methyltransferase Ste14